MKLSFKSCGWNPKNYYCPCHSELHISESVEGFHPLIGHSHALLSLLRRSLSSEAKGVAEGRGLWNPGASSLGQTMCYHVSGGDLGVASFALYLVVLIFHLVYPLCAIWLGQTTFNVPSCHCAFSVCSVKILFTCSCI